MKISTIFPLVLLMLSLSVNFTAQADCGYWLRIRVHDEAGNTIKSAKLKLDDWKGFYYRSPLEGYEAWGLRGLGTPKWTANLKVSAKGFTTFHHKLNISCGTYEFLLQLRPKASKAPADFKLIINKDIATNN